MRRRTRWLVTGALWLAGACAHPSTPPRTAATVAGAAPQFLLVNDVYVIDTLSDGRGGLARVATLRQDLARTGPTLFVLAGDVLSPSLMSKYFNGRQMVEAFTAAHLDYATFGNHEFELARDTLVARVRESGFRWISSNCVEASGQRFPGVAAVDTVRMGGYLVGLFGLTLPGDYRAYVKCSNPDSAARWAVDSLTTLHPDLIVGLTHQAVNRDHALLTADPRISLILGGHEHEAHDSLVGTRHVLKADANSRTAQLVTMVRVGGGWQTVHRLAPIDRTIAADAAVAGVVRAWTDSIARRLGPARIIGTAVRPIDGRDSPSRNHETALGDLVTDAFRVGTGADVALLNSGTMRLDDVIAAGPVTNLNFESIFLFADETRIVTFSLTGDRLRALLEHGIGRTGLGAYPQVSGLRALADPGRPAGSRIVQLTFPDGKPITPDAVVNVAFDVYPACAGGDGYVVPEAASACQTWSRAPRAADLLVHYIEATLQGHLDAQADGRMVFVGQRAK